MYSITEIEKNQKQVQTLTELPKRKVVEHNSLITSIAKMDKTPLKMFELAVSYINTEEPPKDHTVYLSKKELFSFFKVSDNDKHTRFKQAIEKMQKQAFFQIKEEAGKGFKFRNIVPIPYVEWTDYHDKVTIQFSDKIIPYLINLKKNFTQHALSDIAELNSKYSIILYRWLSMNYNQYEHYSNKGGRRADQVEEYRNPSISIKELREMTDTVDEYPRFDRLEHRVLKEPIEEINENTSFNVTYDKVKKGRTIDSIVFHITKKHVAKNENYKQEQQDEAYLSGKANKEQEQQKIFAEAMQSEYTKILLENNLLFPTDFMDLNTMAELQRLVYPLYDQLKEKKGITQIEKHLSYVADKQEDYSKRNIVKYLQTAIKQYLSI